MKDDPAAELRFSSRYKTISNAWKSGLALLRIPKDGYCEPNRLMKRLLTMDDDLDEGKGLQGLIRYCMSFTGIMHLYIMPR
jgi:hypothetical protein